MNNIALNSIINTIVPAIDQHTVLIDSVELTTEVLSVDILHSDDEGEIEIETITIDNNGTITRNGSLQTVEVLSVLPLAIREVLAFFLVVLRDGAVPPDNAELEIISNNKEFFLAHEEAFVPAYYALPESSIDRIWKS